MLLLLACIVTTLGGTPWANAEEQRHYELVDGTVRFICEGPEIIVPAWGEFSTVESGLIMSAPSLTSVEGHVDIPLVSIRTDDWGWDKMFRSAGFLEIDEFPVSRFVVDKVTGAERLVANKWVSVELDGEFTIHGVTKKIVAPARAKWTTDPRGSKKKERVTVHTHFHILWEDYKIDVPEGSTRKFAGDGAHIQVELTFKPGPKSKKKKKKK